MNNAIKTGSKVKVLPSYNHATKRRDLQDEFSGASAQVMEIDGRDALIWTAGGKEVWINVGRLASE